MIKVEKTSLVCDHIATSGQQACNGKVVRHN
jgi:hypothetical protein